jgi:HlyD family secretion protein
MINLYQQVIFRATLIALLLLSMAACEPASQPGFVGTLERDRVELKFESNEPLLVIHVKDGQAITTGELLLEQDSTRAKAKLAAQVAINQQAAARLAELERGPRPEEISAARARLEGLRALTINAAAQLQRSQDIFDRDLSDQAALDRANAHWKSSRAQKKAARESLSALLHGTTIEELQQAAAQLASTKAGIEQAELDLDRTRIHAPVNGIIDKVLFQVGERPAAGSTVAVVLDDSRIYARVYIPEEFRSRVIPGKTLEVNVDGQSSALKGTVRWVSSDASFTPYFALTEHDRSRLSYLAEIDVENAAQLPIGVPLVVTPPGE